MTQVYPYEIILGQRCERRRKMNSEWDPRIIVDFNKAIALISVVPDIFHNSGEDSCPHRKPCHYRYTTQ
jgi:hypothetical protein